MTDKVGFGKEECRMLSDENWGWQNFESQLEPGEVLAVLFWTMSKGKRPGPIRPVRVFENESLFETFVQSEKPNMPMFVAVPKVLAQERGFLSV